MHPIQVGRLRFIFGGAVFSFGLAADATFEDIARTLGELSSQRYGDPLAIDVTFAVLPRSFVQHPGETLRPTVFSNPAATRSNAVGRHV
jgi:hypothetical protein